MLVEFDEEFAVSVEDAYAYFRSPADWPRLFGAFGDVEDRGGGWHAVPLRGFPLPLVARVTTAEPLKRVRWEFGGFWQGEGQVSFAPTSRGVLIRGYERISLRPLLWLAPLVERLLLEKRFKKVWESGWRRLREQAAARSRGASAEAADGTPGDEGDRRPAAVRGADIDT
jgi:hypothetical protein